MRLTVFSFQHRMSTIMKYDKIMVLDYGDVKEFGTPEELLANELSLFYGLVHGGSDLNGKRQ